MTRKHVVALLFGGRSSEHSISCVTAAGVLQAIDRDHYDVIPVGITRDGAFVLEDDDAAAFALTPDAMPSVTDNGTRVHWPESSVTRELTVTDSGGTIRSLGDIDIVFPILHGPYGEDGTVQGLLELLGLPYVGAGVLASAVGMDKHFTKTVLQHSGLPVAPWRAVTESAWRLRPVDVVNAAEELGYPVFVKPARAGSSIGVARAATADDLPGAIETALAEDDKILIEAGIDGREIEVAVLGGRPGEAARASVAGEIVVGDHEFYDYESKYLDPAGADVVCPASLSDEDHARVRSLALRAFEAIEGAGLARVDFFLTEHGFVVNEVNTMPGFTPISMFPKCWEASGVGYSELIDELIDLGLARGSR